MVVTIIEETYNNLTVTNGDINQAITQIYTDLNRQKTSLNDTNATQQTAYLNDYSKLQQIGKDPTTGGYDWANATLEVIADAQNGAAQGMLINFYKTLVPYKWCVYWCRDDQTGPILWFSFTLPPSMTANTVTAIGRVTNIDSQAYLYAGYNYDVNWGLADKLTGTGKGDVNAIWYMMLLGSERDGICLGIMGY